MKITILNLIKCDAFTDNKKNKNVMSKTAKLLSLFQLINESGIYEVNKVFVAAVSADLEAEKGTMVVHPLSIRNRTTSSSSNG